MRTIMNDCTAAHGASLDRVLPARSYVRAVGSIRMLGCGSIGRTFLRGRSLALESGHFLMLRQDLHRSLRRNLYRSPSLIKVAFQAAIKATELTATLARATFDRSIDNSRGIRSDAR